MGMTGVEQARPRTATASHGVPEQRSAPASAGLSVPRPPVPEQSRGDHTHSEPPPPRVAVVRTSVRGQVLDALRAALVSGELAPGEVYSAPVLGERFGVSATPVREAMQQLAREGAVEVVPNRGFRVAERTARELSELAEVRALIEVPVILKLARTVAAGRWASLRPGAEETVRAAVSGDLARYAEADRAFHRAVLSLGGNEQLVQVADDLRGRIAWSACDLPRDAAQHVALLDALEAQDTSLIHCVLREHFGG
ncbi:GntR family transcriptional regulator [Streptomyces sp. VRA16 Mangrove soil]|uniref:GntR family transcriptional regulator n=1 Tax=Streptomyces sp. VRA16 Mangrove soil TaxID=2817434 RepID=UPI001A9F9CD4|nr:GntR family transcriptional regulator [Streptomyces sp. VRA16 Mangrove soil]MBO1331466.1 GntR family transcriptional regulator [Streptomyces sp. VRA16 Mangrove soil]